MGLLNNGIGGGGGDGGSDGGGGGGGDGGSDGGGGGDSTLPPVLSAFVTSPVGFILGIILQELLGGLETITTALIDAIRVLFVGSGPGTAGEVLGLADVPTLIGQLLVSIIQPTAGGNGGTIGDAIVSIVGIPINFVVELAGQAGPLQPVVLAGGAAAVMIGGAWVLRQVLVLAANAIPGAEVLLP